MRRCPQLAHQALQRACGGLAGAVPFGSHGGITGGSAASVGVAAWLFRLLHTASLLQPGVLPPLRQPSAAQGAARQLSNGGAGAGQRQRVAVGVSGGVDSAVAALLLQRQGHDVVGVFMRNWDESEETGNQNCSVERDLRDAAAVCRRLGIPLHEADFVSAYWNEVFSDFLAQCGRGLTPNPDLACNRHIKFDALLRFADELGVDAVATGHYAQLGAGEGGVPSLLRGADAAKDQSYFLATVQPAALRRVHFPVGHLQKGEVRRIAAEAGLAPADKRSSAGICFIGRRNFGAFLSQYIQPMPGRYVDVDSGADLGFCPDLAAVTHGQRPGIGGAPERIYAVGKDVVGRRVYVAQGRDHPALLCTAALLRTPHWLSGAAAEELARRGRLHCQYKARYGQPPMPCTVHALDRRAAAELAHSVLDGQGAAAEAAGTAAASSAAEAAAAAGFQPSAYCRLHRLDSAVLPSYLVVCFERPAAAITPQQACVLYQGDRCLGAAAIAMPGRSLHELAAGRPRSLAAEGGGAAGSCQLDCAPAREVVGAAPAQPLG